MYHNRRKIQKYEEAKDVKTAERFVRSQLRGITQMPSEISVVAVEIDNGKNAALLAIEILALKDESLKKKLEEYRKRMRE